VYHSQNLTAVICQKLLNCWCIKLWQAKGGVFFVRSVWSASV